MIFRYFYGFAVCLFSFLCSMSWRHVAAHLALLASLSCHVWMFELNLVSKSTASESTASATGPLPLLTRYAHVSVSERDGKSDKKSDKQPRIPNDAQKLLYIVSGEDPVRSLGFELMYKMFQEELDDMSNACYDLEYLEEVHICMSSRVYTHVLPHVEKVYYYFNELRSDFLLDDLKVLVISMVSNIQFECCDTGLLQENWLNYCEECQYAQTQRGAISVCMHSMISDTLCELKSEYDQTWSIALY